MEFGIFLQGFIPRPRMEAYGDDAEHRVFHDEAAIAQKADECGWKYIWVTEHHFLHEYSHQSAPEVFLPYLAATTERIHLGSGIFNIDPPVNHPVRTAERVAMLDILSDGRFEFGVGRGSGTTEVGGFGIDDYPVTREMFDEALPEILRMWATEGEYSFSGRYFSVPPRIVLPKPYTKPHPPLWVAAGNAPTYEKAARMGMGVLGFSVLPLRDFAPRVQAYKAAIGQAEPIGGYVNDNVMTTGSIICHEDGRKAREMACDRHLAYLETLVFRYLDSFARPNGIPPWPTLLPEPTLDDIEKRIDAGFLICGDPDEVTGQLQRWADIGVDQMVFGLPIGLSTDEALNMVELVGREVVGRLDADPVHRTVRHRDAAGVR